MTNSHMDYLEQIAAQDVATLREKEKTYGGSWKKRGGVGAFMMLARKMDRLENIAAVANYDIFAVIRGEGLKGADGTLIAEIRDLRCYLMLVEAEMAAQSAGGPPPEDTEKSTMVEWIRAQNAQVHSEHGVRRRDAAVDRHGNMLLATETRTEHPAPFGYDEKEEV